MLERVQLLRNVGQFDNVATGANLPFSKLTTIYAENGRGKTTLAAIFRSLANGDTQLVSERQRLGSANLPHVIVGINGTTAIFTNGAWNRQVPEIVVFDDQFVADNVYSGLAVGSGHRERLHELIIGAQGVQLNNALQV